MAYTRLSIEEREEILRCLGRDNTMSWAEIGRRLDRHPCTIQREISRNGGNRATYSPSAAQQRADDHAQRPRCVFSDNPDLKDRIEHCLREGYSPYATAMLTGGVSTETIYQGIYQQRLNVDPGTVLRTLRGKRRHRRDRQPTSDGNYLGVFTPISHRPAIVETRSRVGDWEGDLIAGSKNQSAIITLTERCSRFQVALDLPHGHTAAATMTRIRQWLTTENHPVHTITWDRGAELTHWKELTDHHGIAVYFCDPKSPWQRGTVENANRQLRFWFPKGTNLNIYTQTDLNRACRILNTSPRRLHNGATAHHIYTTHTRTRE